MPNSLLLSVTVLLVLVASPGKCFICSVLFQGHDVAINKIFLLYIKAAKALVCTAYLNK